MHPPRFHDDPRPRRNEPPHDRTRDRAGDHREGSGSTQPQASPARARLALTPSEERALRSFTTDPSFGAAAAPLGTDDEAAGATPTTVRPYPPVFTSSGPDAGDPLKPFLSAEDPRAGSRLHPTWTMWSLIVLAMAVGAAVLTAMAV
ncbi:hypothetical protein [Roseixanthobacter glucoisosaccharinicivorans]|uniref:hypothetical protein n=1 Tax=Roseixanthobacter glucoisosaccharinicivorans TaxID=3119923 RepID=UPI00372742D7